MILLNLIVLLTLAIPTMDKNTKRRQSKNNTLVIDSGSIQYFCENCFVVEKFHGKTVKADVAIAGTETIDL